MHSKFLPLCFCKLLHSLETIFVGVYLYAPVTSIIFAKLNSPFSKVLKVFPCIHVQRAVYLFLYLSRFKPRSERSNQDFTVSFQLVIFLTVSLHIFSDSSIMDFFSPFGQHILFHLFWPEFEIDPMCFYLAWYSWEHDQKRISLGSEIVFSKIWQFQSSVLLVNLDLEFSARLCSCPDKPEYNCFFSPRDIMRFWDSDWSW